MSDLVKDSPAESIEASPEKEHLDQGEKSETSGEEPQREIESPISEKAWDLWSQFSEEISSSPLIDTQSYLEFSAPQLQAENTEPVTNQQRQKNIEELRNESKESGLSVERKSQIETELKRVLIEQAYSDFLFVKQNIAKLNAEATQIKAEAHTPPEQIEARLRRKTMIVKLDTLFVHYRVYMVVIPNLIIDYLDDENNLDSRYITNLNDKLYKTLGKREEDLPSGDSINQVLYNLAENETKSDENIPEVIAKIDEEVVQLREQITEQTTAADQTNESASKPEESDTPEEPKTTESVPQTTAKPSGSELDQLLETKQDESAPKTEAEKNQTN